MQVQLLSGAPFMAVVAKWLRHKIVNLGIASSNLVYRPIFAWRVTVVGSLLWAYANREENVNELPNHRRLAMLQMLPVRAL